MAVAAQTDSTPLETASLHKIKDGDRIVAVSRDLLEEFKYGDKVEVCCNCIYEGEYFVEDTMNKRFTNRIDILIKSNQSIGKWQGTIRKL